MIIHEIHDLSNAHVINLLKNHLSSVTDHNIIENYHPDYDASFSNLFYILGHGRYKLGKGKYFVIEDMGEYICSAGWNEYELVPTIALALTRMFINKKYRSKFYIGNAVLPVIMQETRRYDKTWITSNSYNKSIYTWFERNHINRTPSLEQWPEIYRQFRPIGLHTVYYTEQHVVEFLRTSDD